MADAAQADLQDRPRARLTTVAVKSIETRRLEGRQRQQRHREGGLCLKRVRAAASPRTCSAEDCNRLMIHCADAIGMDLHRNRHATLQALIAVRQAVSQEREDRLDAQLISAKLIPALVRLLLIRPRSHLARDTVLEAAWICTNLACAGEAAAAAVLAAAPVLALHLDCAHGYAVAEQCAWALGNLAGEGQDACQVLGANGVVLPLGRLLLRGCKEHAVGGTQAAACAAWALANILFSCPSEVGHLLYLSGFPRGLTAVLRGHRNRELAVEAAWLLAFITAGPEAHMYAMIKHGAAEAVSAALLCEASSCPQQGQGEESLLDALLRSIGNMAPSRAAAGVFSAPEIKAAIAELRQHALLAEEAQWALGNLDAMDRCI
ncbi:hypothetical protein CVIRNUC_008809 [Coccomyxa viridis]|uniref:Uncharacterized protein n=1 Tax=Coccomyxa viridis TaxID=1274662 RepID=A0AAV1IHZ0_9CHLO|nr:hypothetical protein CVIRNUC_008809 [Coccomyxa viridis]